jgi:hypothetical protein
MCAKSLPSATRQKVGRSRTEAVLYVITVASLRRAADAFDADLVYAIVPRRKLRETISARALELAQERIAPITNSVRLEAQGLSRAETAEQIEELARELQDRPRELWR